MSKKPFTLGASHFIFQDLHFHGFWAATWSVKHPEEKKAMLDEIFGYMESGKLKDVPFDITVWKWDTKEEELKAAVERSGQGFHGKKQIFVFED
jgi:trans-2-enoyl-CoA reductase